MKSKERKVKVWFVVATSGKPLRVFLKQESAEEAATVYGEKWWKVVSRTVSLSKTKK